MVTANNNSIFDRSALAKAIEAQGAAYDILRWLVDGVKSRELAAESIHNWLGSRDAVLEWLGEAATFLPSKVRATCLADPESKRMSAMILASFLSSTLDVVAKPGVRTVYPSGCRCDVCGALVEGSHLRPKKIDRSDRIAAEREIADALDSMTKMGEPTVLGRLLEQLKRDPETREWLALVAYGKHLLRRSSGEEDPTAAALVLWRQFAWTSAGSPKPGFRLSVDLIIEAEKRLKASIDRLPA